MARVNENVYVRNFFKAWSLILSERVTRVSVTVLGVILLLGIVGPYVTPYHYAEQFFYPDGTLMRGLAPMSEGHILGTTAQGHDVLSRLLYGARPTVIVGLGGGTLIVTIGTFMGVVAGFYGGTTESAIMRVVDLWYVIPLIPFAIVLLVFMSINLWMTILIIGVIQWRGAARVLRSQVLQIKERPYIEAARATGASDTRIVTRHILPNVMSMVVFYFAFGIGLSILVQASLAFIGVSDPFIPTWGVIVRNAYTSGSMASIWWWSLPPGFLIGLTVLCTYLLGRGYESLSSRGAIEKTAAQGGL